MLTTYPSKPGAPQVWTSAAKSDASLEFAWLDLLNPTDTERAYAEKLLGEPLPTRDQVSAIERSSRLQSDRKVLRLNVPAFVRDEDGEGAMTPLGFVVTPHLLVSVRYAESRSFTRIAELAKKSLLARDAVETFVTLIEEIASLGADRMEAIAGELSRLSRAIFLDQRGHQNLLRKALFETGRMQREMTQIRAAMYGVSRIVGYLCEDAPAWIGAEHLPRLHTVRLDIASLTEFDQQMDDRLQFLLDAVLGFINNDQNDIMKVLTVVSVVTIPPMILAGIWGMNFKTISEYDWPHGYAFALTVMAISVILPLAWFKYKRWF